VVAAYRSQNPRSPTVELLEHWRRGGFVMVYARQIRREYLSKLAELDLTEDELLDFADDVARLGVLVPLRTDQIKPVTADPQDDVFVACALMGNATHLVTYDPHIRRLGAVYQGVAVVNALEFLTFIRRED
jgi:uncharacterized protein